MNYRAAIDVGDGFAEDFMRDWGGVTFAEEEEPEDVCDRVAFGPFEVDVRDTPRDFFDVDQCSCDGVGDHGTSGVQDAMLSQPGTVDHQVLSEFRSIRSFDFEEEDGNMFGKAMELTDEGFDAIEILNCCDCLGTTGDKADGLIAAVVNKTDDFG